MTATKEKKGAKQKPLRGGRGNPGEDKIADPDKAIVDFLYDNRGYAIDLPRWHKLTDAERANIKRWVEAVTAGKKATVPPCLLEFDTNGGTRVKKDGPLAPTEGANPTYYLSCDFGRVSFKDTASIPCEISKESLNPARIEELLCGTSVDVLIELRDNAERDQRQIKGTEKPRFKFTAISRGYTSRAKSWKFPLAFTPDAEHATDLLQFAGRKGRIELTLLGPADQEAGRGDDDEDDDSDDQPKLFAD